MTRRRKGGSKRRETDPASNQFSKCSPPSRTHRDSQIWVEKKGEGGDRGDLVEKKESPKWERAVKPQVKMGTEDWVLKGTKLITNTKNHRLKI